MGFQPRFIDPAHAYFTGLLGSDSSVGGKVAQIGDHWYQLDLLSDRFRFVSIAAQRPQEDISDRPGEQTLSSEGLWKRTGSTWIHGAGQRWYDRDEGDPRRFYRSRGVDPWEPWELSLLPDVELVDTEVGGWRSMAVGRVQGATRLAISGNNGRLKLISQGGIETEVAGLTGAVWAVSTGGDIYVSDTAGVHRLDSSTTKVIFNSNVTTAIRLVYAKNRIFALAGAGTIYDLHTGGTETAYPIEFSSGWGWTGGCEGQQAVFFCGSSGDKGRIYAMTIADDATTLNPPTVALELPDGEVPWTMVHYVGFIVIGTSKGVRVCQQDGPTLTMGELVGVDPDDPIGHDVRCLEPQDRFVWYGYDESFADSAGLGRLDLSTFITPLAPAFASDLQAPEVGQVTCVATHRTVDGEGTHDRRWFTAGTGLYKQSLSHVTTGFLETGRITFNVADEKTPVFVDLRHSPLVTGESVSVESASDTRPFTHVGTSDIPNTTRPLREFEMNHNRAIYHELRVTLSGVGSATPRLTGVSLAAQVAPDRTYNVYLPVLLHETITIDQQDYPMDIQSELNYLLELVRSQRLVRFRQGKWTGLVFVEDFEWIPHHSSTNGEDMNGTIVLKLKSAESSR